MLGKFQVVYVFYINVMFLLALILIIYFLVLRKIMFKIVPKRED